MIVQNLRIIQWKATRMLRRTSTLALWEKPEERGLVQPGLGGSSGGIQQQCSGAGHSSGDRDGFFKEMRGRCTRNYSGTLEQKSYKVKTNQHPDFLRTVKHSSRLPTEAALCLSDFQTPQYPALRNLIWPQCYPCTQQHLGLRELSAFQLMSTVIMLHYGFFPNANATVTGEISFFTFNQKVVRECG